MSTLDPAIPCRRRAVGGGDDGVGVGRVGAGGAGTDGVRVAEVVRSCPNPSH